MFFVFTNALQSDMHKICAQAQIVAEDASAKALKTKSDANIDIANYEMGIFHGFKMAATMVAIKCPINLIPSAN